MKSALQSSISRRQFMGTCGKMTSISLLSSVLQLKLLNAAVANTSLPGDYKALVCLFLGGGNDSFNMLAPYSNSYYRHYVTARQQLALAKDQLIHIPTNNSLNMNLLGVHSTMPDMASLYRSGDLAYLANVGTLVRPTTMSDYNNKKDLPLGLFSHREQQVSWQTSVPDNKAASGWIGRMAEVLNDSSTSNQKVTLNIALKGNRLQAGDTLNPLQISKKGANALDIYHGDSNTQAAYNSSLNHQYASVLEQHYNYRTKEIIDENHAYNETISNVNVDIGDFPNTNLGSQFKQVALSIAAREELGVQRQTFFVSMGGFDHHGSLLLNQQEMLPQVNDALAAFNQSMHKLGLHDQVTTYTASDFGRTLSSNSDGTDHAWGGNQMIMGGAVKGKKVYGRYPADLRPGQNPDIDTGRGRFIPTTSVDEMHTELASWYGIAKSDLSTILPNWGNFTNEAYPVGFMQS